MGFSKWPKRVKLQFSQINIDYLSLFSDLYLMRLVSQHVELKFHGKYELRFLGFKNH